MNNSIWTSYFLARILYDGYPSVPLFLREPKIIPRDPNYMKRFYVGFTRTTLLLGESFRKNKRNEVDVKVGIWHLEGLSCSADPRFWHTSNIIVFPLNTIYGKSCTQLAREKSRFQPKCIWFNFLPFSLLQCTYFILLLLLILPHLALIRTRTSLLHWNHSIRSVSKCSLSVSRSLSFSRSIFVALRCPRNDHNDRPLCAFDSDPKPLLF